MQPPAPHAVTEPTVWTPIGAPSLRQCARVLLFAAIYTAAFVGLLVAIGLATPAAPSAFAVLIMVGGGVGSAAGVSVYLHLIRRDGLALAALGFTRPTRRLAHLLWQIPLIIIGSGTLTLIVVGILLGQQPPPGSTVDELASSATLPTMLGLLVVAAVVTPLWEEVLFRGLLFSALTRRVPVVVAAIVSSAIFAAVHVVPLLMPYLFLLGLGCCWLYTRHRTLWAPIALHAANNALIALAVVMP